MENYPDAEANSQFPVLNSQFLWQGLLVGTESCSRGTRYDLVQ